VRGAHHDALHHGLAADQDLFTVFEYREQLRVRGPPEESLPVQWEKALSYIKYSVWPKPACLWL
jgi:hypothetical protein